MMIVSGCPSEALQNDSDSKHKMGDAEVLPYDSQNSIDSWPQLCYQFMVVMQAMVLPVLTLNSATLSAN